MELSDVGLRADTDGWCRAYRKGGQVPMRHRHAELEVNLVTHGGATYLLEGTIYELGPGSLFWQRSTVDHSLLRVSDDLQMWIAVFRPEMLQRLCPAGMRQAVLLETPLDRIHKRLPTTAREELSNLAEAMQMFENDIPRYNTALAYWLLSAWSAHRQGLNVSTGGDVHPAVDRAARLLRSDDAPETIDTLARRAGLSASQLSRLFAQQIGMTIVQYRQRVRLDRFRDIFSRGRRYNLTQAALQAGFGSYPQFHRVFKRHFGFSPAEYRRRLSHLHCL